MTHWTMGACTTDTFVVPDHVDHVYLVNLLTHSEFRGEGHARAMLRCLCWLADSTGVVLVTHPGNDRLLVTYRRYGFLTDLDAEMWWEGQPFMVRPVQPVGEQPWVFKYLRNSA